jgi:hypothetical protein
VGRRALTVAVLAALALVEEGGTVAVSLARRESS